MIRIGVIGTGYIARRAHLSNLPGIEGVRVTALHNRTRSKAEAANAEFCAGRARIHDSWEALVADADVDAVSICTPVGLHAEQAQAAARAGKHILVEKPIALTLADADAMIAAAEAAGVTLMVAHGMRYFPPYVFAKRLVDSGRLGRVHSIRAFAGHAGAERRGPQVAEWYRDPNQGGGCLIDLGIHEVDLMRWLVGQPVQEVAAFQSTQRPALHGASDDNAALIVRFAGGVLGTLQESWTHKPGFHRYTALGLEEGFITIDDGRVEVHEAKTDRVERPEIPGMPGHGNDKRHFIECIRTGDEPLTSGREARASLEVVLAGLQSQRTGQVVRLPLV